jgi:hypothetical protein
MLLAPFLAEIPGTSANSVLSPLPNGVSNVNQVEGFSGSIFLIQYGQNLSSYDVDTSSFVDTTSCWSNQSIRLNGNRDVVMCRNEIYNIVEGGNFSLLQSGMYDTGTHPLTNPSNGVYPALIKPVQR